MVNDEYRIRSARLENLNSIKAIERECSLSSWSIIDYENELVRSDSIFLTVNKAGEVIGFMLARLITNNFPAFKDCDVNNNFIELFNIGVKNSYRKRGLGKLLLEKLIFEGESSDAEHIFLEVRKSNKPAIDLYCKLGFEVIYERKNFYHNPTENGLGMKLSLIKNNELDMN